MDLVLDLPQVLQASLLCEWFYDEFEITLLDSAYCNKKRRSEWQQVLSAAYILPSISTRYEEMMEWIFSRKVRVRDIVLVTDKMEDRDFITDFLIRFGAETTSITFELHDEDERYNVLDQRPFAIPSYVWTILYTHCRKLQRINCENLIVNQTQISLLFTLSQQLTEVHLKGARYLTLAMLQACCEKPLLQTLDLTNTTFQTLPSDKKFCGPVMQNLCTLLLDGVHSLSASTTRALLLRAPNLTELSMALSGMMDVAFIISSFPKMIKCTLFNVYPVIDAATATVLCNTWTSLQSLELYNAYTGVNSMSCTEDALVVLVTQCLTLQRLRLIPTTSKDYWYAYRPHNKPTPCSGSQLFEIQIGSVTAATLELICNTCVNLHTLHIYHQNTLISAQTAMAEQALHLLQYSTVKTLILEKTRLNNQQLTTIANMEHLHLLACTGTFTIEGLTRMATMCPNLLTFILINPPEHVYSQVIRSILDVCPKLRTFQYAVLGEEEDSNLRWALSDMIRHFYPNIQDLRLVV